MRPSSRSQSAAPTALTAGIGELFRVRRLREIPNRWIFESDAMRRAFLSTCHRSKSVRDMVRTSEAGVLREQLDW